MLVETAKVEGFSDPVNSAYEVEVAAGENNDYYVVNPIINLPELGKFVLTKQKADGSALGGAVFSLYEGAAVDEAYFIGDITVLEDVYKRQVPVRNEAGEPVVITTTVDGTGMPNTPQVTLKAGTYFYKELTVPDEMCIRDRRGADRGRLCP